MPTTNSNIAIFEFRPGPGGQESAIWMGDLMRMYTRYADKVGWKVNYLDSDILKISGLDAFNQLKWETGTHRVQTNSSYRKTWSNSNLHCRCGCLSSNYLS